MDSFVKHYQNHKEFRSGLTYYAAGLDLKILVWLHVQFYNSIAKEISSFLATSAGYIPGVDSFMDSFVKHYQNHKEFRSGLIVKMMQAYVMKLDGINNTIYGEKVLRKVK